MRTRLLLLSVAVALSGLACAHNPEPEPATQDVQNQLHGLQVPIEHSNATADRIIDLAKAERDEKLAKANADKAAKERRK